MYLDLIPRHSLLKHLSGICKLFEKNVAHAPLSTAISFVQILVQVLLKASANIDGNVD